ncbi:hypothetical protein [Paracoccus sp. (in: a-proteobacteria)]|uniref:hypothetical protein n=1 Tax=Paracoccus sp. TaxID=267 RepID=UPI00289B6759|nr:hypothetical protein [Paracoccus sp. (in: a-proteobacteria)]
MWAAEGYKSLLNLMDEIWDLTDGYVKSREQEFLESSLPEILKPCYRDAIDSAMVAILLEDRDCHVRICSPGGVVLKPSWAFFAEKEACKGLVAPLADGSVDDVCRFLMRAIVEAEGYFQFIDEEYFTITTPDPEDLESLGESRWNLREVARKLSPFRGWALCVEESFDVQEFAAYLAPLDAIEDKQDSPTRKRGRPGVVSDAAKALDELYDEVPTGDWKVVAKEVEAHLNRSISDRSIQRAAHIARQKRAQKGRK